MSSIYNFHMADVVHISSVKWFGVIMLAFIFLTNKMVFTAMSVSAGCMCV